MNYAYLWTIRLAQLGQKSHIFSKRIKDGKWKSTYGYKAHLNVDEDGFIKTTDDTAGNVHDSHCFTDLLGSDETAVYAGSAYQR